MDCDVLLSWMTHVGEGSWAGFRNAVEVVFGRKDDLLCRMLRIRLSDLGFADFFIEGTQQWRMLPPVLGGLAVQGCAAAFSGGRTPLLAESLREAAEARGCRFETERPPDCPTLIRVVGGMGEIEALAGEIEASFEPDYAARVAEALQPIPCTLDAAPEEAAPLNWKAQAFDFRTCMWVERILPNAACEFTPTYGRSKFFLHRKRGRLLRMSKRESLYAAAMLKGVRLIEYDAGAARLSTPLFAPLPELYARAACLCSGRPAEVLSGRITYSDVTPEVAALVMVAAGQPHPGAAVLE